MLEEDKTAGISHGRTKANLKESKAKHNPKKETIEDVFFFWIMFFTLLS